MKYDWPTPTSCRDINIFCDGHSVSLNEAQEKIEVESYEQL